MVERLTPDQLAALSGKTPAAGGGDQMIDIHHPAQLADYRAKWEQWNSPAALLRRAEALYRRHHPAAPF